MSSSYPQMFETIPDPFPDQTNIKTAWLLDTRYRIMKMDTIFLKEVKEFLCLNTCLITNEGEMTFCYCNIQKYCTYKWHRPADSNQAITCFYG